MKKTFRPRMGRYLVSFGILFSITFCALAIYLLDAISILICFIGLSSLTIFALYRVWRQSLSIDAEVIQGNLTGQDIKIYWQDIIAIKLVKPLTEPNFLLVSTRVDHVTISLKDFNDKQVWQAVEQHAPPSSLEEEAYKRLPDYNRWKDYHRDLINRHIQTLSVKTLTFYRIIFWIVVFSCLIIILPVLLYGDPESPFCVLGFAMPSVLCLALFPSSVEADMDSIGKKTWLGRYKIRWDEIERMEHTRGLTNFVFYAEHKRLVVPGPATWSGGNGEELVEYLQAQIAERQIEVKVTFWADYKWSKNVKVE